MGEADLDSWLALVGKQRNPRRGDRGKIGLRKHGFLASWCVDCSDLLGKQMAMASGQRVSITEKGGVELTAP
jgi:hypothetical protein